MDSTNIAPLDYFSMIRRRRVEWLTPILASALVGWLLVKYLPREYRSSTTIGVTAALVSPSLISQTTPFDNQERMRAIQQQLLSVPILARVARAEGASESQVTRRMTQLRNAISITVPEPVAATNEPRRLDTFVIIYTDAEPELAQRIANRLASVFVEENSKVRTERANDTTAFIDAQLAASQVRMTELEARLRRSKEAHVGQLPEQTQANLQTLAGLRQQIVANATPPAVSATGSRSSSARSTPSTGTPSTSPRQRPASRGRRLGRSARLDARARSGGCAGDLHRPASGCAAAQGGARLGPPRRADRASAAGGRSPGPPGAQSRLSTARRRTRDCRGPGSRDLDRDGQETQRLIKAYQARVEAAPMVEQQLATIERDYALERQQYTDLSSKQRAATISASVERNRSGERFSVLEPATFPTEPLKPVPMRIMLGSLLAGLCLGAALTLGREYLDTSVHDERDIREASICRSSAASSTSRPDI